MIIFKYQPQKFYMKENIHSVLMANIPSSGVGDETDAYAYSPWDHKELHDWVIELNWLLRLCISVHFNNQECS